MAVKTKDINAGPVAIMPEGDWNKDQKYTYLSEVLHNGDSWYSKVDNNKGNEPVDGSEYWARGTKGGQYALEKGELANEKAAKADAAADNANQAADNANQAAALANSAKESVEQTELTVQANEEERKSSETERKANEAERQSAESSRQSKESERQDNEYIRETYEAERQGSELTRISNEKTRIANELTRQANESDRQTSTEEAIQNANTAADNANNNSNYAKEQGDYAKDIADHPAYIGGDNYWYLWDYDSKSYVKSSYAKGSDVDYSTMTEAEKESLAKAVSDKIAEEGGYAITPVKEESITTTTVYNKNAVICIDGIIYIANKETQNLPFAMIVQENKFVTQDLYGKTCFVRSSNTKSDDWDIWLDASNDLRFKELEERVARLETIINSISL